MGVVLVMSVVAEMSVPAVLMLQAAGRLLFPHVEHRVLHAPGAHRLGGGSRTDRGKEPGRRLTALGTVDRLRCLGCAAVQVKHTACFTEKRVNGHGRSPFLAMSRCSPLISPYAGRWGNKHGF